MSLWDKAGVMAVRSCIRAHRDASVAAIEIGRLGISAASSSRTRTNGWMVGWLDGWMDGWMGGRWNTEGSSV